MRGSGLFISVLAACAGGGPRGETPLPVPVDAGVTPSRDASVAPPDAPVLASRGEACLEGTPCAEGLECLPGGAGYCASACDASCTGACVELPDGERCLKACERDADCRVDEGYVCDPRWHACLWPSTAAIAVPACPAAAQGHDAAFGASRALSTGAMPGTAQHSPSAVVTDDGGVVALFASRDAPSDGLGLARVDRAGAAEVDQLFGPAAGTGATDPMLARGPGKRVFAVWRVGADVRFAASADRGATWGAPVAINAPGECADPDACTSAPVIAAGAGAIYVLYGAGPGGLRVRASRDGGASFGAARTIASGTIAAATVGRDGRLHVVALLASLGGAYGSASHRVEYVRSEPGGAAFARPIAVSQRDEKLPFVGARPAIAVDSRRKQLVIAYVRGGRDGAWDLVVAAAALPKTGAPGPWRRARIGDQPPCALHALPAAALDAKTGRLHLAWIDSRGGGRFARASCVLAPKRIACTEHGHIGDTAFAPLAASTGSNRSLGGSAVLAIDEPRRALHAVWAQPDRETSATRIRHARGALPKR